MTDHPKVLKVYRTWLECCWSSDQILLELVRDTFGTEKLEAIGTDREALLRLLWLNFAAELEGLS